MFCPFSAVFAKTNRKFPPLKSKDRTNTFGESTGETFGELDPGNHKAALLRVIF